MRLTAAFPQRYAEDVDNAFKENDYRVCTTYLALDEANWNPAVAPARTKKVTPGIVKPPNVEYDLRLRAHPAELDALATFTARVEACYFGHSGLYM